MKKILLVGMAIALWSCSAGVPPGAPAKSSGAGFCGSSTQGACQTDGDCITGGCSGQICQSKKEEGQISTCEYRDCYNAAAYGLKCGCVHQACQWR
jgi:eight-cysteine-cluster-containing protein